MSTRSDTTYMLTQVSQGDARAAEQLMPLVYNELRALAAHKIRGERVGHTLQPTALVNEAYLRLIDQKRVDWNGRTHFFAVSAVMMRRVLVDHARKRLSAKRGGNVPKIPLVDDKAVAIRQNDTNLISLDEALKLLKEFHERQARVVELRFFGGMNVKESANVLGVSERTVKNDWRVARAWLRQKIGS